MKHSMICVAAIVWAVSAAAQQPPPFVSPQVNADRTLTLRLFAPNASKVSAAGELDGQPHEMKKGSDGVWTVTIGPLAPDIYTYAFNVDGVSALDPRNANTKYGYGVFGAVSVVEMPGDAPQFYDAQGRHAHRPRRQGLRRRAERGRRHA